jgi:ribonuclease G
VPNLLVINADGPETRVALVENGQVVEIYIERRRERGIVGNIYKGKVLRVLPGMQAAFVDIGTDKAAFLYVADVRGSPEDVKDLFVDEEDEGRERRGIDRERERDGEERSSRDSRIEDLLRPNQEILLQVAKAPIGTKGSRATSYISLPGRNLVFMPTVDHVGISRRIGSEKERKRLRAIVDSMRPPGTGFIVRTVAEGVLEAELRADMEFLIKLWNSILKKSEGAKAPSLIYNDLDLLLRTVRDLFTSDIDKLIIDNKSEYERLLKFTGAFMPEYVSKIDLYDKGEPVFDAYGIEMELDRALDRKVFLKSGGSLVIDQGEALTAIDVNTGRFVGKRNLEETITKTNLEACKEVADQLRLRNIGGIIIIDFIDMDRESNQDKVMKAFAESVRPDRAKTNVTKISELGLVEMTRKRTRESLGRMQTEPCFYCDGKGYLKSKSTVCYEVLRQIRREGHLHTDETLVVSVHPEIAELLATSDHEFLEDLEKRLQKKIQIRSRERFHLEHFEIRGASVSGNGEGRSSGGRGREEGKGEGRSESRHEGRGGREEARGGREEARGGREEGRGGREEARGGREEARGGREEGRGGREEGRGGREEGRGGREEGRGGREEGRGGREEARGGREEARGGREEARGGREEGRGGREEGRGRREESRVPREPKPNKEESPPPPHTPAREPETI